MSQKIVRLRDGGMETLLLGYLTESHGTNENKL
jgi:hypothetical protein